MINSVTICSSDIFFTILLYFPIEDILSSRLSGVFPSSLSGSGSGRNLDDLFRGEGKVIVRLLQEIPLVGEWLECGGVFGVGYSHQSVGSKRWLPV